MRMSDWSSDVCSSDLVETGDWRTVPDQGTWYYSNILEHQIFWTRETFEYIADLYSFSIATYTLVNHKGRRAMRLPKRLALSVIVRLAPHAWFRKAMLATGRDPGHFGAPGLVDHAFAVLTRAATDEARAAPRRSEEHTTELQSL